MQHSDNIKEKHKKTQILDNKQKESLEQFLQAVEQYVLDGRDFEYINKQFVKLTFDVNYKFADGSTPLHKATYSKVACQVLLLKGAKVDEKNNDDSTPLHVAINKGHIDICKLLLANKDVKVNEENNSGVTPLRGAVFQGYSDICELMFAKGADVDVKDNEDYTPLHWGAIKGYTAICKLLLAKNADVNVQNDQGCTPLHLAVFANNIETCEALIEHGADFNVEDETGFTPLDRSNVIRIYEIILKKALSIDPESSKARILLEKSMEKAIFYNRIDRVRCCEKYGAKFTRITTEGNAKGSSHIYLAFKHNRTQVMKIFINKLQGYDLSDDQNKMDENYQKLLDLFEKHYSDDINTIHEWCYQRKEFCQLLSSLKEKLLRGEAAELPSELMASIDEKVAKALMAINESFTDVSLCKKINQDFADLIPAEMIPVYVKIIWLQLINRMILKIMKKKIVPEEILINALREKNVEKAIWALDQLHENSIDHNLLFAKHQDKTSFFSELVGLSNAKKYSTRIIRLIKQLRQKDESIEKLFPQLLHFTVEYGQNVLINYFVNDCKLDPRNCIVEGKSAIEAVFTMKEAASKDKVISVLNALKVRFKDFELLKETCEKQYPTVYICFQKLFLKKALLRLNELAAECGLTERWKVHVNEKVVELRFASEVGTRAYLFRQILLEHNVKCELVPHEKNYKLVFNDLPCCEDVAAVESQVTLSNKKAFRMIENLQVNLTKKLSSHFKLQWCYTDDELYCDLNSKDDMACKIQQLEVFLTYLSKKLKTQLPVTIEKASKGGLQQYKLKLTDHKGFVEEGAQFDEAGLKEWGKVARYLLSEKATVHSYEDVLKHLASEKDKVIKREKAVKLQREQKEKRYHEKKSKPAIQKNKKPGKKSAGTNSKSPKN